MDDAASYTVFSGSLRLASGNLAEVAAAVTAARDSGAGDLIVLADQDGRTIDIDPQHRLPAAAEPESDRPRSTKPARGRPKLGVTAREVTLLPRHWDWLSRQPGGASAALRRLVDQARRENAEDDRLRETREAVHRVLTTLAGNLPGYEDALRALHAGDESAFVQALSGWPQDIRVYVLALLAGPRSS